MNRQENTRLNMNGGKAIRPTTITKKNFTSLRPVNSNLIKVSPEIKTNSENKPPTSHLVRQNTGISSRINCVPRRDLLRRSKSFAALRGPLKQPVVTFRKPAVPIKRTATVTAPTSNIGATASKQAKVKIPSYDYKSRYNDLLEKHNSLKEKYSLLDMKFITAEEQANIADNSLKLKTSELNLLVKSNSELQEKYLELNSVYKAVNDKQKLLETKLSSAELKLKQCELSLIESEVKNLEYAKKLSTFINDNKIMKEQIQILEQRLKLSEVSATKFQESIEMCHIQRKIMHNTISDLKGNIRVFCRVRPALPAEENQNLCNWNYPDECSLDLMKTARSKSPLSVIGNTKASKHDFQFDLVFPPHTTQREVFHHIESLIQSALDGYNVCIFAYGQTGSGKTFTMEGNEDNLGLIPRSVDFLFEQISLMEPIGWSFVVTASFVEIYNEHIRDLLNDADNDLNHEIKLVDGKQNEVYVSNLQEQVIRNAKDLKKLLRIAQTNRITAQTDSNDRSSRSHSVAKIIISSMNSSSGETFKGTLNLVDLAGSESPKTSIRMEETKNINKSLSQLGKVILSLQQKQDHIPYRNSKLTFLLMPCLGGSSKTLMFVNVNPLVANHAETLNSLRFASQVNQIKTLKAKKIKASLNPK